MGAHGRVFGLEVMVGVVVGEDKLGELDKELSGWYGMEGTLIQKMFQGRESMGVRDVGV